MKYKEGTYYGNEISVKELIEYCREHDDIEVTVDILENETDLNKIPIHIKKADPLKRESDSKSTTVVWRDTNTGLIHETELSEFNARATQFE